MVRVLASGEIVGDNDPRAVQQAARSGPMDIVEAYLLPRFGIGLREEQPSIGARGSRSSGGTIQGLRSTEEESGTAPFPSAGGCISTGGVCFVYSAVYAALFFVGWVAVNVVELAIAPKPPDLLPAYPGTPENEEDGTEFLLRLLLGFHLFWDLQERFLFLPWWFQKGRSVPQSTPLQTSPLAAPLIATTAGGAAAGSQTVSSTGALGRRLGDSAMTLSDSSPGFLRAASISLQFLLTFLAANIVFFAKSPSAVFAAAILLGIYKLIFVFQNEGRASIRGGSPTLAGGKVNPYISSYWWSVGGAIALYGYASARNCFDMETIFVTNIADPLCSFKQDPTRDLVVSFLLRLCTSVHFLTELQTKINHREQWTEVIAKVPAFTNYAESLMSTIITLLCVGGFTLLFGNLFHLITIQLLGPTSTCALLWRTWAMTMCVALALVQFPTSFGFEGGSFGQNLEVQSCGMSLMGGVFLLGYFEYYSV
ncbi:unnamed protein product [Amoebophrya sp. A25]|nr:unnamed protein product [Amoebophrya sp. A25]|eukprot:GSA25T00018800001.1